MHLTAEELVDIAEGTRPEALSPHLAACEPCRHQVRDLRAMMSAADEVDLPEPSPLFWDHFSARVSEAVAADGGRGAGSVRDALVSLLRAPAFQASVVFACGLLIVVFLNGRAAAPDPAVALPGTGVAAVAAEPLVDVTPDDASLTVVASMTDDQDLETVREAGFAPRGSAEHAVTHMTDNELRELRRLLREELTRPGA